MPARLPTLADFPSYQTHLTITPPPTSSPRNTNVLILLHGLGDNDAPFARLGTQLALPETACISLQAPTPLPFELSGFHWGDDMIFDQTTGEMDLDTGFSKAVKAIKQHVLEEGLLRSCGYTYREIMIFGLGQGAMAAVAAASSMREELGGIISIGGALSISATPVKAAATPVLILGGSSKTMVTRTALERLRTAFKNVEYHKWNRPGDGMPTNREEMLPIMRFFARRLRSGQGIPEGSVEIG